MAAKDEGTRARHGTHPVTQDDTRAGTGGRRTRRQARQPDTPEPAPAATQPTAETAPIPAATQRAQRGNRSARTPVAPRDSRPSRRGAAAGAVSGEAEPNAPAAADIEPAAAAVIEDEMAPAEAAAETGEPTAAVADDYAATTPGSVAASALADGDEASSGQEPGLEPGAAGDDRPRRDRHRVSHSNALGMLIERHFGDPASPCRSYSDLERHSGISREALSRYVTARPDRRRSPTIDTLVAIADAMHLSLESVARAAAASVKGVQLPPEQEQAEREEVLGTLVAALTPEQFGAVVELLRQLRPAPGAS